MSNVIIKEHCNRGFLGDLRLILALMVPL